MSWKKLTDKLICLRRYLFLVTQSPRENVWHLGSVFLAVRALRSDDNIETCNIHPEKHACRCYVLRAPQDYINAVETCRCHRCDNMKPRPQTHKVSPPRPYTFHHEVGLDVFEIVDSVDMRFSILNPVCTGTTYDQAWIVRESETLCYS